MFMGLSARMLGVSHVLFVDLRDGDVTRRLSQDAESWLKGEEEEKRRAE